MVNLTNNSANSVDFYRKVWYNGGVYLYHAEITIYVEKEFVVPEKFKQLIMYTSYIVIVLFLFVLLSASVVTMIQPTFFPDTDISGFKNIVNIINTLFGIVSAALAIYSLYASVKSTDDLKAALRESEERLIKEVDGIKSNQAYDKNTPSTPKRGSSPDKSNN